MKLTLTNQVITVLEKIAPTNYHHLTKAKSLQEFAPSIQDYGSCFVGEMRCGRTKYNEYNEKKGTSDCRSCAVIASCLFSLAVKGYKESFEYYISALATHAKLHHPKLIKIKNGYGKQKWF